VPLCYLRPPPGTPPDGSLRRKPSDSHSGKDGDVKQELDSRTPASAPLPNANDTPMSDAAGIVVTEMNTPISVLDRASVSDTTPTTPARAATIKENQSGVSIRWETGRSPNA